jgi:hypothetical protein
MIYRALSSPGLCAPASGPFKVFHDGGECVGVTNGSYAFSPALAGVERDIEAENAIAVRSGYYVTVALLTPLSTSPFSVISPARMTDELDGAYAAQFAANSSQFGGSPPMIQLVLANEGSTEQAWQPVTSQLIAMKDSPAHLVTVIGMGVSVTQTEQGARLLGRAGIPMVASVLTADDLSWLRYPGLIGISPDNLQQVTALNTYLTAKNLLRNLLLVSDSDPSDDYTKNLSNDFSSVFRLSPGSSIGYGPPASEERGELKQIATQVCPNGPQPPPVILYAGREVLLPGFLRALRSNYACHNKQLTVVTASDAAALKDNVTAPVAGWGNLTVIYSDLVNPGEVTHPTNTIFKASKLRSTASLSGTWTISTFNAMAAAAQAISLAGDASNDVPKAGALWYYLRYLRGKDQVNGATGPFSIGYNTARPISPQVPIIVLAGGKPVSEASWQQAARLG